jgi:transposase
VSGLLGVKCFETVLGWSRQAEIDSGTRTGITTEASEELRRLRRENAELRRANGILRAASIFFAAELDRPSNK